MWRKTHAQSITIAYNSLGCHYIYILVGDTRPINNYSTQFLGMSLYILVGDTYFMQTKCIEFISKYIYTLYVYAVLDLAVLI